MKKTLLNLAALAASGLAADTAMCGVKNGAKIGLPNETIKSLNIRAGHQEVAAPVAKSTAKNAVVRPQAAIAAAKKATSEHKPAASLAGSQKANAATLTADKFAKKAVASGAAFAQRAGGFVTQSHAFG